MPSRYSHTARSRRMGTLRGRIVACIVHYFAHSACTPISEESAIPSAYRVPLAPPTGCATYQAQAGRHGSPRVPQESTVTEQRLTAGPGQTLHCSATQLCPTKVRQRTKMSPNFVILTSFLSITSLIWRPRCERRNFMAVSSIFFSGFFQFLTPKKVASWSEIVIWS